MAKFIKRIFTFIIIVILAVFSYFIKIGYDEYKNLTSEKPIKTAVEEIKNKNNYTKIENIREIYINAVISAEDKRFYTHDGIDIIGTLRAIFENIKEKELRQGGSSITQQLAKNMYFPNMEHTLKRKVTEVFIAKELERTYGKNDILEYYMNIIYYGSGYYSIYDASMGYFNKTPYELSDYECTLLAGIPNAPSVYSPDVNPDLAKKRQEKVVECMVECGYIEDVSDILPPEE